MAPTPQLEVNTSNEEGQEEAAATADDDEDPLEAELSRDPLR